MSDSASQIDAVQREVGRRLVAGGEEVSVLLRRTYDAPIAAVWAALTEPERLQRWFLPVSGDLRVGGTFQTEGNAGGEILRCTPPHLLTVTWGDATSVIELRLSPAKGDSTALELEHTVPIAMAGSGAGALFVGPGWDSALMALSLFLRGEVGANPVAAASSPEGREFSRQSVHAWAAAIGQSGTATATEIAEMTAAVLPQWAPDRAADQGEGGHH